jgi:hypothetical protein
MLERQSASSGGNDMRRVLLFGLAVVLFSCFQSIAPLTAGQEPEPGKKSATQNMGPNTPTTQLVIENDATKDFDSLLQNKTLKLGRNLVATNPSGSKLWAEVSKHGNDLNVRWELTNKEGHKLPARLFDITSSTEQPRSEERWLVCVTGTDGKLHCTETKCVPRFPCPKWVCG